MRLEPRYKNVAIHFIDIASLVRNRPDLTSRLVAEATAALKHLPLSGLDIPVHDVSDTTDALRLINTGVHEKVVLEAGPDSVVRVLPAAKVDPWTDGQATYVVAGGLGDMGQRLPCQMVERGARHLATISRRTLTPQARDALQEKLEAIQPGIHLYCLQGDVSSATSMQSAAATLARQNAPPVRGIIQAAVIQKESPLEGLTYQDFKAATGAKVGGTLALHRALTSPNLRFVLSLSSFAGIVGAGALAGYNAGNAVQDAFAHQDAAFHKEESTHFLTVDFGWTQDAAFTAGDEKREGSLRRAGCILIFPEELTRFFKHVLGAVMDDSPGRLRQAIIGFDPESLAGATAHNSTIYSGMFSHVREAQHKVEDPGVGADVKPQLTFEEVIAQGDTDSVIDFVSRALTGQLARLMSVDTASIDARSGSVLELGVESLAAVELRNWVKRRFEAPLQSSEMMVNQTVWALAERIVARSKKVVGITASA